jgi:hypothetical protein
MQRVEVEGYLDSFKADLAGGVLTLVFKGKNSEFPIPDSEQLAETARLEMIMALEISPLGKDGTVEVDGKLASIKADLVSDLVSMTFKIARTDLDARSEKVLAQATALHIKTLIACSARQKSFLDGTRFEGAHVEMRVTGGG